MAAQTFKSKQVAANEAMVTASQAGVVIACRREFSLTEALEDNDVIYFGDLPAGHVPVDVIVDADELDTGVDAIVLEAGLLNAGKTAVDTTASGGASWIGGSTLGQAAGIARATGVAITRVAVDNVNDRAYGVQVTTAPGTGATTGKIGFTLLYRAAVFGV